MSNRARILAASLLLAGLASTGTAAAQTFGRAGDVSFAADRLMGFYLHDPGDSAVGLGIPAPGSYYSMPRFGMDFFVSEHFEFGGTIGYAHQGDYGALLLAPRLGYAIDIGDSFGFWPRGGVTFRFADRNNDEVALTMEGMFWLTLAPHFGITFGPAIDIGIVGDGQRRGRSIGLITVGVFGWF